MSKSKKAINILTSFNGIYLSGFYIRNEATITALALLFENVHLPNQLEMVIEFAKKNVLDPENRIKDLGFGIKAIDPADENDDPFVGLSEAQRLTAHKYLYLSHIFCMRNHELLPTVFTTDMLKNSNPMIVKLVKKGKPGQLNTYKVSPAPQIVLLNGLDQIESKLNDGYVPIIGQENSTYGISNKLFKDNKAIASILAMKSIEMLLPSFKDAKPQDILEAREKLKDFLPPFWSSMLKLSVDAKTIIKDSSTSIEAIKECQNIVDTLVRPALVDLIVKMEKERRNWFYKIISPVSNAVKMVIGNPSLNQATLIRASLALATDMTSEYIQNKQKVEDLKSDTGLTYLLEVHKKLKKTSSR